MTLLLIHAAATHFMFGVILTVQIVHYPLFAVVGDLRFVAYHGEHMKRIGRVVAAPMVVELTSGAALLMWKPVAVPAWLAVAGLGLVIVIWLSTWLVQVPQHAGLSRGFDGLAHAQLVRWNWVRTFGWGLRSLAVLYVMQLSLPPA